MESLGAMFHFVEAVRVGTDSFLKGFAFYPMAPPRTPNGFAVGCARYVKKEEEFRMRVEMES